ncbi:uncharacterized protein LOC144878334 [Branchiostoma floridae x Branchiostoma japonicum]
MAQLSRLAQLYLKISDNLTEDDVRDLRALLGVEILGMAKVQKATPLEIFDMLEEKDMIGEGKLEFLVQILNSLGQGKLAKEAERLEQEKKKEETADDAEVQRLTPELASLHIRELTRLINEPMNTPGSAPSETDSSTGNHDAQVRLETLLTELNTPAVMKDKERQFDLYCQIGDLFRAKLYNLQSAQKFYQSMLECSQSLPKYFKQAKAYNRIGLTYDMLGVHEEAVRNHERVLDICRAVVGNEVEISVAHQNLASSLTLSGKVSEAKASYKTALLLARKTGNKIEEMDIYCKFGDLHRQQLKEPQISYTYYTKMLTLAKYLRKKYWEMQAYNRLGLACRAMQDNEIALEWARKYLKMSQESANKREQMLAHIDVGILEVIANQARSHIHTALQLALQNGDQYGQMWAYWHMGDMQRGKFSSPRTAIQYYEQYLSMAIQVGDRREEGRAYGRLGQAHVDMREYQLALEWFQKHLKISEERDDKKEAVTAHVSVGKAYRFLSKIEQAKSHFNTALQMSQQTGDLHGQMAVYCEMGEMQREQLHSPRTAIQYYEQQLTLTRQLMNSVEEALTYERLGLAHYEMGEYEKALQWHQKHLDKSQDNGDNKQQIRAHTNLGRAYRLLGSSDQATARISTALQLAKQTGDLHGQMEIYFTMGEMQRVDLHSPRTAVQYYEQYLALARQLGDRSKEAVAYSRLGRAHGDMGEYKAAQEWFQRYLRMSQESGDRKEEITAHTVVGNTYVALAKLDQATSHFNTALILAQQTDDMHGQMQVYYCMGEMHKEQLHSPRTAIQYYEQYLALARQLEDRYGEGVAYSRLGQAHSGMGEYEEALEWHKKYLRMSQEDEDKTAQITAHQNIADSYQALGKLDLATSHYQSATTIAKETEISPLLIELQGPEMAKLYADACRQGSLPVHSTRAQVVGQFRAGKTCFINRLTGEPVREDEPITDGINISSDVQTTTWKKSKG